MNALTIIFLLTLLQNVFCANILFIAAIASRSHNIWNNVLISGLLERKHNVTMIGNDFNKSTKNFTFIYMEDLYKNIPINIKDFFHQSPFKIVKTIYDWGSYCCKHDLKTEGLKTLLNYPEDYKFDLIIIDASLDQCLYPLIERFHDPPVVFVTAFPLPPVISNAFGNDVFTSYIPYYNTEFTDKMNLYERVLNFVYIYWEVYYKNYIHMPREMEWVKERFGQNIRSFEDTERKISILLCNTDPVLDYPMALAPNIIPVGGLHVKPAKELPPDLQLVMDKATRGVVLFSLGSTIKSALLDKNIKKIIIRVFSKFPQTFVWKYEEDDLEDLPDNIVIRKWLPQSDLSGHKNTKLLISHGGALSTQEAMYHGVPVLGVPLTADQRVNIAKMVDRKLAQQFDIRNIQYQTFYDLIHEMLNNLTYYDNAKKLSERYRDQPQTPLEKAVFWIEYVLRHGSVEYLNLRSRDMHWYQTANLDVLILFCSGIVLIYALVTFILTGARLLFRAIFCKKATITPK